MDGDINKMKQLKKHLLNTEKTMLYIKDHLTKCNTLCDSALQNLPFQKGDFYTFLPNGTSKEKLHQFKWGGVFEGGQKNLISDWIYKEKISSNGSTCIFDENTAQYSEEKNSKLFQNLGVYNKDEVFYVLNTVEHEESVFLKCLYESDVIWHSLTVISCYPYKKSQEQKITKEEIDSIVKSANIILLLAYDAEAYLIWERKK